MGFYREELLNSIYALGCMYYELGYFAPAEKIFSGLVSVSPQFVPARLGLGVLKLELGLYSEAEVQFRLVVESGEHVLESRIGLASSYISQGDLQRARSMLGDVRKLIVEFDPAPALRNLYEAIVQRCL